MTASVSPTVTFEVTSMDRVDRPAAFSLVFAREVFPAQAGWDARVDVFADGVKIGEQHFDRIDGESGWYCSASFREGCLMPQFMNGLFSRCTIPQFAVAELASALDDATAEA